MKRGHPLATFVVLTLAGALSACGGLSNENGTVYDRDTSLGSGGGESVAVAPWSTVSARHATADAPTGVEGRRPGVDNRADERAGKMSGSVERPGAREDGISRASSTLTGGSRSAVAGGATIVSGSTGAAGASRVGSADPALQSAQACLASCNGEWAPHGLGGVSCLCRTNDFGRDCFDQAECQGDCLLEAVRTQVVDPGPPATGYFIGKCSEFVTTFGCVRRLRAGSEARGPVDLSDPPPEICVD